MPEYYHHDLARWEGEGEFHGELLSPSDHAPDIHESIHPRKSDRRIHPQSCFEDS
jgi:hypothetical protein